MSGAECERVPRVTVRRLLGYYAGDFVKSCAMAVSGRLPVEPAEQSVEDFLAADLSLGGCVVALADQGGAELDGGRGVMTQAS